MLGLGIALLAVLLVPGREAPSGKKVFDATVRQTHSDALRLSQTLISYFHPYY